MNLFNGFRFRMGLQSPVFFGARKNVDQKPPMKGGKTGEIAFFAIKAATSSSSARLFMGEAGSGVRRRTCPDGGGEVNSILYP